MYIYKYVSLVHRNGILGVGNHRYGSNVLSADGSISRAVSDRTPFRNNGVPKKYGSGGCSQPASSHILYYYTLRILYIIYIYTHTHTVVEVVMVVREVEFVGGEGKRGGDKT